MSDREIKAYRVRVTLRNNLLLSAIEAAGYKSQAEFARDCGISITGLNALVAMRTCPLGERGEFTEPAKKVMEVLGACPTDLWSEDQLTLKLKRNTGERSVSSYLVDHLLEAHQEAMLLPDPEKLAIESERDELVSNVLNSLTQREIDVTKMRFGIGDENEYTLEETAAKLGVTRERIRQIEAKAMRKLRNPSCSDQLRDFLDTPNE